MLPETAPQQEKIESSAELGCMETGFIELHSSTKKKRECWWKSRMYENFSAFSFLFFFFFLTEAVLTGTVWIDRTLANKPHMHAHACTAGLFLLRSFISCFLSSFSFKLLISHVFVSKPSLWWYFSTNFSLLCRLILLLSPPLAVFGILTDTCFYGEDE